MLQYVLLYMNVDPQNQIRTDKIGECVTTEKTTRDRDGLSHSVTARPPPPSHD